ncbi:MAG TPA: nuclear transport factor 2 family protein [Pseudonocardiaceae bacterium]
MTTTATTLPGPIAAYLTAKQNHDVDALLATLSEDAVITDEGTHYRGADAIREWNQKASTEVAATYAIREAVRLLDRTVVAVEVAGNFPGSPVTLFFHFTLRADKVAALTILA